MLSDRNRSELPDVADAARARASCDPGSFDIALAALRQRILRLTCTIIARDELSAWLARQEVENAIERVQRCVARIPEAPARDDAERRLRSVLAIADQMIACAPAPSPEHPDAPSASDPGAPGASGGGHDLPPGSFDPAEALQNLHGQVIQLEAMTHAASEAVTQLPFPEDREDRRVFDRAYVLVTKVADETHALVRYGDELISALAAYLQRRRAGADGSPAKRS